MVNAVARAKRQVIGAHVEALLVRSKNGLLLVDVNDQFVGRRLSYHGEYGLEEPARLRQRRE